MGMKRHFLNLNILTSKNCKFSFSIPDSSLHFPDLRYLTISRCLWIFGPRPFRLRNYHTPTYHLAAIKIIFQEERVWRWLWVCQLVVLLKWINVGWCLFLDVVKACDCNSSDQLSRSPLFEHSLTLLYYFYDYSIERYELMKLLM